MNVLLYLCLLIRLVLEECIVKALMDIMFHMDIIKKHPIIISKTDLNYISELIKDVEFKNCSFTESIKNVKDGDFVYLDPPYAPENSKSFVWICCRWFQFRYTQIII